MVPDGAGATRSAGDVRPAVVDVALGPDLVAARTAEIRAVVEEALLAVPERLRLSLDAVQRFDAAGVGAAAGVGVLLRVHRQARRQGVDLICAGSPRQLVAVLRRTALDRVTTVTV
ncbi:STAS domain-containing protein [Modestobacter roseus]|uniref:Anti-anti-sigma regulatory factor n=1 Tax=Modestobacter roseus TaxID=1181884 RepID=A0A562IPV6_9ACTN|nr:STAS domain-containing protein [Modestobacter roseus]MQA34360.1 hypothetical protein [Modestobacter roseus]TWH72920.1 anti-anti-sigma regulatory factor [Modestobacter roseus]